MAGRRTSARAQLDRETKAILDSLRAEEITTVEARLQFVQAVKRASSKMTRDELLAVQPWVFDQIFEITDELAKLGHPAPGNDPGRPN